MTSKQLQFCREYLVDLNATQAAVRAGYSASTANREGTRLLAMPRVQAKIDQLQDERATRVEVEADEVLRQLWLVATADPNELIEYRRVCCRHCHGIGFGFQRTESEMKAARRQHAVKVEKEGESPGPFDEEGGIGFDATKDPHPDCPECFGEGIGTAFLKDTRTLSAAARALYAGVKVTKDGFEVKMRDQQAALIQVGKHLGMFVERTKTELTGKDGGPIQSESVTERIEYLTRVYDGDAVLATSRMDLKKLTDAELNDHLRRLRAIEAQRAIERAVERSE